MTLIYLKKHSIVAAVAVAAFFLWFFTASAQSNNSVSLSVTPTLFEMAAAPQQVWSSNVKVINNNRFSLTVYANAVNFAPQGETGQGKFLPVFEQVTEGATLAEWIDITNEPITLAPGDSYQIPFTVTVPADAAPGGHFAAIMIGTRPPDTAETFRINTSQIVTSLFFVRIAGDVIEDGSIREFRTTETFLSTPNVNFEVRFQNKGNVHIQPQGEILIKNMWGKERGVIPINHRTHFGNVLPDSIRMFEFNWKGESQFSDIGRYSAELSLAYGRDERKFATSRTYFWVVPVKSVLTVLGVVIASVLFVLWAVKAYVRRMLALEGYQPVSRGANQFRREGDVLIERRKTIQAPVRAGWLDLTERLNKAKAFAETLKALMIFVWSYRLFFGSVLVLVAIILLAWIFVLAVTEDVRDYEVTIENPDANITISSEEIIYDKQYGVEGGSPPATDASVKATTTQGFILEIINSSNTVGAAAAMQRQLEPTYRVSSLRSDFGAAKERSVIVYHKDLQDDALALRALLGDLILSALPPEAEEMNITIYIGNDYVSQ